MSYRRSTAAPAPHRPAHRAESSAHISERCPEFNGARLSQRRIPQPNQGAPVVRFWFASCGRRISGAIPKSRSGQGANSAQSGDAHGQPQSHCGQCDREGERSRICEHPMAEVIRLFGSRLMAGGTIGEAGVGGICRRPPVRQSCRAARPERDHDVLVVRDFGSLFSHRLQFRRIRRDLSTLRAILTWKVTGIDVDNPAHAALRSDAIRPVRVALAAVPSDKTRRWGACR